MQSSPFVWVTALLGIAGGIALWEQAPLRTGVGAELATAVTRWLDALPAELKSKANLPLDDEERTRWHFVPGRYLGLELGAMDEGHRERATAVLRTMLSVEGLHKTMTIVGLESVLRELESKPDKPAVHRDPGRYALLVLGTPAVGGSFVVRFQGHHVSLQVQVQNGRIVGHTPQFLGTNPHEIREGKRRGQRALAVEEDLGRALLHLLSAEQQEKAIIAAKAPADVILGPGKPPSALGDRAGLPWTEMTPAQQGVLWRLIEEYARLWHGDLAASELEAVRAQIDGVHFAWAGSKQRGQGHYYRIHGERFAIEYDNTQNGANHVHTVWRDFENDFGGDAFRAHIEAHQRQNGR